MYNINASHPPSLSLSLSLFFLPLSHTHALPPYPNLGVGIGRGEVLLPASLPVPGCRGVGAYRDLAGPLRTLRHLTHTKGQFNCMNKRRLRRAWSF